MSTCATEPQLDQSQQHQQQQPEQPEQQKADSVASIKAIDKKSVHRICCNQVVVDLATAVKELLENSLDAGATIIGRWHTAMSAYAMILVPTDGGIGIGIGTEIRLGECGSDYIEVVDNGTGIDPSNYLALSTLQT
jgi:DNA mismatch repair protein PMS2